MPRFIISFLILCLSLAAPEAGPATPLAQRPGWVVLETTQSFEELVAGLKRAVRNHKMGVVTQASASAGAKGQGIVIPGNQVIGVYRNDYARRMLDASLAAGIEAPIRFYVTEQDDGTATLSWKTPSHVFSPYVAAAGKDLQALARELDMVFAAIGEEAATR